MGVPTRAGGAASAVAGFEWLMGVASLGFAAGGLLAPGAVARVTGLPPELARALGARDLVVGVLLLRVGGPLALAARGASDVADAVLVGRRQPAVAALAASSAAANLALAGVSVVGRRGGSARAAA